MVGRDAPLHSLRAALAARRPSLWLVAGEAGIGKTCLVHALEAAADGCTVLHGEGVEFGGSELALGPFVAALRALGPLEASSGPGELYERVLDRLRATAPALLVLEDLHWADHATLALLAFLARNLRDEAVVVVATYRVDDELPEPLRRLAAELVRRPLVTRIELEPLERADTARLVEALEGGPVAAGLVDELHARAGGNPFFVEELWAARATSLQEAVLTRTARLDERMLVVLAAAGGRAAHPVLERLAIAPAALRAGLDAGVLVEERDDVAFRHGLFGEVLYARLLPAERVALHAELAAALADPAQRAHHFHRAGRREEALAASLVAAGQAEAVFAYDAALRHYGRALELGERTPERLARAAQAARYAGASDRALALCREAIERTDDPVEEARLYERLGGFIFWDDEAALRCYDRALALLPGDPSVLAARGNALMGLRRWAESRACCEAALAAGAPPRITLGLVLAYLGEPEAGEAHLHRALELATTGEEIARAYLHLGELRRLRGDHAGALEAMVDGEREAARHGLRGSFGHFMYVNGADDLLRLGRWDEAAARLEEAARMDLSRTAAALRRAAAGMLAALRGDLETARVELHAGADDDLPSEFLAPLAAARAALAFAEEDRAAARSHARGALAGVQDPLYTPPLYALAVRAASGPAEAEELLGDLQRLLARNLAPPAQAFLALARAEHARVGLKPGAELWRVAAEAFEALGEPYPAAYARLHQAEAILAAGGERAAALDALATVHTTAAALGASPLLTAANTLARRARLRVVEPRDAGLTAREREVLRLLADGLTNRAIAERLFISQKTVSAHMAHIYGKLDVHSRVQAATRARELGLVG